MILRIRTEFGRFIRPGDHAGKSREIAAEVCAAHTIDGWPNLAKQSAIEWRMWKEIYGFWLHRAGVYASAFAR